MQPDPMMPQPTVTRAATYDAGLRTHFQSVYNTMSIGLVITGAVAFAVSNVPALTNLIFGTPLVYVFMLAPLAFVFFGFSPNSVARRSASQLRGLFFLFSGIFGVSMATIFLAYTGEAVARVFFITAAMFAATSIYGYTTKKDLSGMGSLMVMGAIGLLIAMLVNMFLHSSTLQFVISSAGVLIYTGLTAWDTQSIKESYRATYGGEANSKMAVMGALNMYMNFIMLFQFLLQLFGGRR